MHIQPVVVRDRYVSRFPVGALTVASIYFGVVAWLDANPLIAFIVVVMSVSALRIWLGSVVSITATDLRYDRFLRRRKVPLSELAEVARVELPLFLGPSWRLVLVGHEGQTWMPRYYGSSLIVREGDKPEYVIAMAEQLEEALAAQGWTPSVGE